MLAVAQLKNKKQAKQVFLSKKGLKVPVFASHEIAMTLICLSADHWEKQKKQRNLQATVSILTEREKSMLFCKVSKLNSL
ncbi:MAG: hypothetical protein IJC45_07460 [Clostridia bacterium]|nr:hypothetical protein [Clostridia bacterium]